MINKAVIVAAGLSSRLYPLTLDKPKGLLPIQNKELLRRSIETLKENNINEIALVIGYKHELMQEALGDSVTYLPNPFYEHCNNMGSLWFAKSFVQDEPFIYLHGDIIYHSAILSSSLQDFVSSKDDIHLVTDFKQTDEEAMKVKIDQNSYLIESSKQIAIEQSAGEWTGIAYIKDVLSLYKAIEEILFAEGLNFYDTHAFNKLVKDGKKIYCSPTKGLPWIEIDFLSDYEQAKELFEYETI